ncbi:3-ketodihydrosphingosine reductase-like protein tsc10 [Mollisia scopiformis]|uniref:3-dehydrosphinganine reductase n=1 Tax=Mollisia scopiformis TaxID=149040 RepID=A0A194XIP0_MOLSC|nr:3-ketodihydrosphingosine reductase-like protein tsc10 [Mollisia scopiformis]KUJ19632.1 3-ketodihydrosphingosine reductase-like protein tsc10 [Mollisia scopiformis]
MASIPLPSLWTIIILIFSLLLIPTIMGIFGGNKFNVKGKTVLLTGASEGMGKSVAIQLAQKGANIIIVARNVGKLEAALAEIKAAASSPSSQRFQYISADVSEPDGASRVIAEAIAWNNGSAPSIVWCIAGSANPGLFIDTPRSVMRHQMDVNFWSCVDMAQAILSEWLGKENGQKGEEKHLVFTSSVVAFYPVVGYAPYAPSKAAIKSLSDSLVQECLLYGEDVKVHTVFPGTISSPGLEIENQTKPEITHILEESDPVQSPEVVARKAIQGLERGEYLVTVSWLGDLMRGCAWGGSRRGNWVIDTGMTWVASLAWYFVGMDLDGKVRKYGKDHGHPSTYGKK